jgi:hypothetical protein
MICPLLHNEPDSAFAEMQIQESITVRVCPRCGLVFVPKDLVGSQSGPIQLKEQPKTKQILKWP